MEDADPLDTECTSIVKRLEEARPVLEEMMSLGGAVGSSYGVVHRGKIVHTDSFGYRDHETRLPVDTKKILSHLFHDQGTCQLCSRTVGQ